MEQLEFLLEKVSYSLSDKSSEMIVIIVLLEDIDNKTKFIVKMARKEVDFEVW